MLVTVLLVSFFALPAASAAEAQTDADGNSATSGSTGTDQSALYYKYLESIAQYKYAKEDIQIEDILNYTAEGTEYEGADGTVSVLSMKYHP